MRHFFGNIAKARAVDEAIMWTCQEQYRGKIAGKGYTQARSLTKHELTLSEEEKKKLQKRADCFVSLNAKATNDYRNRWALAYCANMYMQPLMLGFFEDSGLEVKEELYAVSCLIQWIFRSRIRDGKEIKLYLPSPRMRELYQGWLKGIDLSLAVEEGVPNEGE